MSADDPRTPPDPAREPLESARPGTAIAERAPVAIGLIPKTIDEAWRFAQLLAKSQLVPKEFRERPHDVMVAIAMGSELGLAPAQALHSICVINGRPSVWGDAILALVMASPHYVNHDEFFEVQRGAAMEARSGLEPDDWTHDHTAAVCVFTRKGRPEPFTYRFTVGQARKAGLLKKAGPWQEYPDRMLQMRARAFAARNAFADVLRGITAREELTDYAEPIPTPTVRRLSDPPRAIVTDVIGPSRVMGIDGTDVADRFVITLDDNSQVEAGADDTAALRPYLYSGDLLRFVCDRPDDGRARLVSFAVAG